MALCSVRLCFLHLANSPVVATFVRYWSNSKHRADMRLCRMVVVRPLGGLIRVYKPIHKIKIYVGKCKHFNDPKRNQQILPICDIDGINTISRLL